jgi:hypothetical protein
VTGLAQELPAPVEVFLRRYPIEQLPPRQKDGGVTVEHLRDAALTLHLLGHSLRDAHVMRIALDFAQAGHRRVTAVRIWDQIQPDLRRRLYDSAYRMWIEPITPIDVLDGVLLLSAHDAIRIWVERRYFDVILEHLLNVPDVIGVRFK